jgi:arsenate reductase
MAEAWARHLKGEVIDAYSAGTHPKGLDPLAVQAMADVGIDLSTHQAKSLTAVQHLPFDYVSTVCSDAHESCPVFPGRAKIVHRGFDDPPRLAAEAKNPQEARRHYARVRDEIKAFIEQLPDVLLTERGDPMSPTPESEATRDAVRQRYAEIARVTMTESAEAAATDCCAPSCCGGERLDVTTLATSIGYTAAELRALPEGANMGLSCGNPTAIASLQPGYAGERFEVLSAGVAPTEVHPLTRQVLTDIGLDTRELHAKSLDLFFARVSIAYAIIVCDQAEDDCPCLYPFALNTLYWPFDDPTQAEGSTEARLRTFRQVRDQIDHHVRAWLQELAVSHQSSERH